MVSFWVIGALVFATGGTGQWAHLVLLVWILVLLVLLFLLVHLTLVRVLVLALGGWIHLRHVVTDSLVGVIGMVQETMSVRTGAALRTGSVFA